MDLLHQRYASPFQLLDNLIQLKEFSYFVEKLINKISQEKNDKKMWEFYLHKVHDKSFDEWKNSLTVKTNDVMDEAQKEQIFEKSNDILSNFKIKERG